MGIALLGLYALLIALAAAGTGRRSAASSFFVNNRSSRAAEVGLSITASCVGASATIGMIGLAFAVGTPAFWWLGAGATGLVVLSLFLAKRVRDSGAYTMPQMAERFLGQPARPLISGIVVIVYTTFLAAQFKALTAVLSPLTGLSSGLCLVIGFALIAGHSFGGQAAVMKTDRLQTLIIVAILAVLLVWLSARNPSWHAASSLEAVNADFPPEKFLYYLIVVGANYLVCPVLYGRLFCARDSRSARRGGLFGAMGIVLCAAIIVCIGLAVRGLVPSGTPQDAVLTTAMADLLPVWLNLAVSLGLVSAVVSSADSCLIAASTALGHDLLKREDTAANKGCVLLLGMIGLGISLLDKSILGFLLMAYDIYACGVVAPVAVGLLLHGRKHIDTRFACAAIVTGGLLGAAAAVSEQAVYSYAGLAASFLITILGVRTEALSPGNKPCPALLLAEKRIPQ